MAFRRPLRRHQKSLPVQALLNQIQAQPPFQTALHHWLDGVLCAPDLSYALAHQNDLGTHQIWLTPEGHQVDKVSVLLYAKPAQESLIAQKRASTASRPNWKTSPPNFQPPKLRSNRRRPPCARQKCNIKT